MDFAEFILAHSQDDPVALALARSRYASEVALPDGFAAGTAPFDLALSTLEVRRKLRTKVPAWYAVPSLVYPLRLSGEQCSSEATARYKASVALAAASALGTSHYEKTAPESYCEVPEDVPLRENGGKFVTPGPELRMADLTGGLGVDSWAFTQVFADVLYNEMQPALADAARHNFSVLGCRNVAVRCRELYPGNVTEVLDGFKPDVIFLDPARRASDGRKVFRLEDCSPDVLQLLPELLDSCPLLLLKLSPMADISLVCKQLGCVREVHVVAAEGECKELLLLLEKGYAGHCAITIFEDGASLLLDQVQGESGPGSTECAGPGPGSVEQTPLGCIGRGPGPGDGIEPGPKTGWTRSRVSGGSPQRRFGGSDLPAEDGGDIGHGVSLFEPGKAMLKAGAFELPCQYGLEKLERHTHLYIGDVPEALKPFGKTFEILETVPLNKRSLKDVAARYPQADVTARNIPLTSEELRKKLGVKDGGPIHIFGTKAVADNVLIICRVAQ